MEIIKIHVQGFLPLLKWENITRIISFYLDLHEFSYRPVYLMNTDQKDRGLVFQLVTLEPDKIKTWLEEATYEFSIYQLKIEELDTLMLSFMLTTNENEPKKIREVIKYAEAILDWIPDKSDHKKTIYTVYTSLIDHSLRLNNHDQAMNYYCELLPYIDISSRDQIRRIAMSIELAYRVKDNSCVKSIEELVKEIATNDDFKSYSMFIEALNLQNQNRMKSKMQAQETFGQLFRQSIDAYIVLKSLLYYCDLLVLEFESLKEEIIRDELTELVRTLAAKRERHKWSNPIFLGQFYLVEANVRIILGEYDKCQRLLKSAELAASKTGDRMLLEQIQQTRSKLIEIDDPQISIESRKDRFSTYIKSALSLVS